MPACPRITVVSAYGLHSQRLRPLAGAFGVVAFQVAVVFEAIPGWLHVFAIFPTPAFDLVILPRPSAGRRAPGSAIVSAEG